jgi:hypothetical protein
VQGAVSVTWTGSSYDSFEVQRLTVCDAITLGEADGTAEQ